MASHRLRTSAVAIGLVLISGAAAAAANASTAYPPSTPTPTVSGVRASLTPDVTDAATVEAQRASSLPRTGTDVALWIMAGGGLVAGGSALVVSSRRRRASSHAR